MKQVRIKTAFTTLAVIMCLGLFAMTVMTVDAYAAQNGQCGQSVTWRLDDSGTLTISGTGAMDDYDEGEAPWYSSRSSIKKVVIGDGVTVIGGGAFYKCTKITDVTIADSVTDIGKAFSGCTGLKKISLPEGVENIWDEAFYGCTGLTSVSFPDSLIVISHRAFSNCTSLKEITFPDGIVQIGQWAFSGCTGIAEITLPESLRSINAGSFMNCTGLTKVTLPDGILVIDKEAFCGCTSLAEIVLPDNVWGIHSNAFKNCTSLTQVTFSEILNLIDSYAFSGCTGLTQITLPENLTEIGDNAFENCTGLEEITFPGKVEKLGISAFEGCTGLKEISIPKSLTWIRDRAFYGCSGLTSITIPNTVTTMDDLVFAACTGLTEVKVSRSAMKAGMANIFKDCLNIKTIRFPEGLTAIPDAAFYRFEQLTDIIIPDTVKTLGNGVFLCCANLESITIPSKVTKLKDEVFRGCSKLETIIIPENVEEIGINTFASAKDFPSGLKKAAILNKDLWIGENSFENAVIYGYKGSTAETYAKENGLTFKPLLGITGQPVNTYGAVGQTVKIKVTAVGYGPLEYQWYYRKTADSAWQKVTSAWGKKASYSLTVAERHDGYQYYCEVTNPGLGMKVKSKTVTLKIVTEKPSITTQPKSITVASEDKAVFKVTAAGEGLSYQWYYRKSSSGSWTAVSAASGKKAAYSLTAAARHNGYQYYCAVTNPLGTVKSKTVTLTVVAAKPVITAQPKAASVTAGNRVTFKITASGTALSYQWQYRRSASGSWTNVSAASGKTASYSLTAEKRHNGYQYRCIVKNLKGSVTSNVVKLTVK